MRKLLRKIILWALAAEPAPEQDAAGMDKVAREIRGEESPTKSTGGA